MMMGSLLLKATCVNLALFTTFAECWVFQTAKRISKGLSALADPAFCAQMCSLRFTERSLFWRALVLGGGTKPNKAACTLLPLASCKGLRKNGHVGFNITIKSVKHHRCEPHPMWSRQHHPQQWAQSVAFCRSTRESSCHRNARARKARPSNAKKHRLAPLRWRTLHT